jgi:hypothetical protein
MNKLKELRLKYRETWSRDWPHEDELLQELWIESKAAFGQGPKSKQKSREATQHALILMRECHEFDPAIKESA